MEKMGKEKQGQMIVYHLIDLLNHGYRLPAPENCPKEVCSCWEFSKNQARGKRTNQNQLHNIEVKDSGHLFCVFMFVHTRSFQIHKMMTECWSSDPKMRPTFKTLMHNVDTVRDKQGGMRPYDL